MITYIHDDILNSDCKYICHQVNCRGVMGAGLAVQIAGRWPQVYKEYHDLCEGNWWYHTSPINTIQIVPINENQSVINMFAQENFGRDDRRYTSYDAFWLCLGQILDKTKPEDTIAIPFGIGCGLGGANWSVIRQMIETTLEDRNVFIYVKE